MFLTEDKLIALWKKRKDIFADEKNSKLATRFDRVNETFEWMMQQDVKEEKQEKQVVIKNLQNLKDKIFPNLDLDYFGVANKNLTGNRNNGDEGVLIMARHFENGDADFSKKVRDIGCILGGFDFVDSNDDQRLKMVADYRIVSNTIIGKNDNSGCSVGGQSQHPSSHFADNNYFFRVVSTVNEMKEEKYRFDVKKSQITLRWVHFDKRTPSKEDEFRDILNNRFPYKFFYMWANKEKVIHPFSLIAYKDFVTQEAFKYDPDQGMNQSYDEFRSKWKDYSDRIVRIIKEANSSVADSVDESVIISDLSKLISIIMVNNQDIKNIRDLVEIGNKAIILWGPPGTGKTYQALELVKEMLAISDMGEKEKNEKKIKEYRFPETEHGSFDIVQFHPNYSYEDFVGGISPKLNGETLNYTLKVGRFKKFCDEASKEDNKEKKFIFIIDEINRADLSAVFGELLYALEYRDKPISIPNFEEQFVIPSNVYVVGTMNNVDKSLVSFDLALRRRFGFYKVMPNLKVLESVLSDSITEKTLSQFVERCGNLNEKISSFKDQGLGLGEDYQIGHAYFLKIKDFLPNNNLRTKKSEVNSVADDLQGEDDFGTVDLTVFELEKLWVYHIEPLLEEYLGNKVDDENIKNKIKKFKDDFIKEFDA